MSTTTDADADADTGLTRPPTVPGFSGLQLIGEGATSRVYRAVELSTGASVAVKLLHRHLSIDPVSVERFRREIEVTRALNHEHIVAVYDLVECESGLALVMELVHGGTLKEVIWESAPLDWPFVQSVLTQLLSTLGECHGKGVVHRDLKPQNLMLDGDGRLKLVDFGISRMSSFAELTRTGATVGSPEYMAPELFIASDFDPRADLYAVGVLTFEMLTGRAPYRADSVALLYHAHAREPVPVVSTHRDGLPAWVDAFVARLLAKDPFDRYQTADEALSDLREKRVLASGLPSLRRRECLACGQETLQELFVCAFCGYHDLETFIPGEFDVLVSPDADREKLAEFLQKLGRKIRPREDTDVLARGVDKISAELLRESARRHGLYASVETRPYLSRLGPVFATLVAVGVATPLLAILFPWLLDASQLTDTFHTVASLVRDLVAMALVVAVGVRAVFMYHRRQRKPALLQTTGAPLAQEYGWVSDLVPLLARLPNGSLRGAVARLVEKHHLLRKLSPNLPSELAEPLEEVLKKAVELSVVLAEVDALFDRIVAPGSERLLGDDRDRRAALMKLSDRRTGLGHHLAETTHLFNRLAGEAVASSTAHDNVPPELLHEAQAALERHIDVSRQVRRELEAVS